MGIPNLSVTQLWPLVGTWSRIGAAWTQFERKQCSILARILIPKSTKVIRNLEKQVSGKQAEKNNDSRALPSYHPINTIGFKGPSRSYFGGFGVTLGPCLGSLSRIFVLQASFVSSWMGNRNALASSGVHRRPGSVARGVPDTLHPQWAGLCTLRPWGPVARYI